MKKPVVTVYTNDKNLWLLNGFQYLFKKYWSPGTEVRYVGYAPPGNGTLSGEYTFVSIARRNYPASEWSTGVLHSLETFANDGEDFMIMMLEDYWLLEEVNLSDIYTLTDYLYNNLDKNILRIDLTADRCQYRRHIVNREQVRRCSVIQTAPNSPYQMSFQAAIWNIQLMREIMRPFENPWQSEIEGSKRLAAAGDKYIVLGTENPPVRYQPVYRSHRKTMDISKLSDEDQKVILKRGWV